MKTAVTDFVILGIISGLTSGAGVLPDGPLTAAVGGTVTFNPTITPPDKPFLAAQWIFHHHNIDKNIIVSTSADIIGPGYEDRISFDKTTGSLELRSLTLSDSGEYRVTITPDGGHSLTGSTRLEILAPAHNIVVTPSSTDLVEFNSSVRLSCSSSGSSLSFLWLNGSSEVTDSDRVQLTDGNTNLAIFNVTRYDQGPFRCHVSNALSNGTSEPVKLSISYGPDYVVLEKFPSQEQYVVGSNINISCSAVSSPSAQFYWFLKGDPLHDTGPDLRLMKIQMNQSGNYSCQAFNNKTLRYQTSQSAAIIVLDRVEILGPTKLEEKQTLVLLCSVQSTLPTSYTWTLNGEEILNNSTVFIKPMSESSDSGKYICQVRDDHSGRISFGEHSLSVQACTGLSAGAIAGIVISYFLVVGGALGGGFYIYKKKNTSSSKTQSQKKTCKKETARSNIPPVKHTTEREESIYENDLVYENTI